VACGVNFSSTPAAAYCREEVYIGSVKLGKVKFSIYWRGRGEGEGEREKREGEKRGRKERERERERKRWV
jgi:hypothetical protein